ncbi:MAG: tRNA preQ1(34) S-adenosylmethionine ribosyltransferase-isomerase QueA [Tissierellia bacterium]|nr:tRNA preQ1(34) S-adenosylmethionine ribosyltransferase-isomerase QueA [Tissierellia bacterium]
MKLEEFNYDLPQELIAQEPLKKRDHSRLLHVDKATGDYRDDIFKNIGHYLRPGDTLVFNDTKVLPARLYGHRPQKEEAIEVLLLKEKKKDCWECLVRPGRKMKEGQEIIFSDQLRGRVTEVLESGSRLIDFSYEGVFLEIIDHLGAMPLPPYIKKDLKEKDRYQTIYAKNIGSSAAPTAGLHFTQALMEEIKAMGVDILFVTLHVGLGTFQPVRAENIEDHHMHEEVYFVSPQVAQKINQKKSQGHRILAVGTTSLRTLEAATNAQGLLEAGHGSTDIFIYPGYTFKMVDGLITNFHLPESTLLMLVSAFSSQEIIKRAYQHAIEAKYRFFSFGDAMFLE